MAAVERVECWLMPMAAVERVECWLMAMAAVDWVQCWLQWGCAVSSSSGSRYCFLLYGAFHTAFLLIQHSLFRKLMLQAMTGVFMYSN